jgi:AcrR family transcriptional regulator
MMNFPDSTPKAQSTKQRILAEGLALASVEGLEATSLGVLAERSGMSKSGLYAHFKSKDELQLQILKTAEEVARKEVLERVLAVSPGLPRLKAFLKHLIRWTREAKLPGGCPFVGAAAEFDDREGAVRDYVSMTLGTWMEYLEGCVVDAIKLGQLRADTDRSTVVFQICAIYLMHHTVSRLLRRPDADSLAERAMESVLAQYEVRGTKRARRG